MSNVYLSLQALTQLSSLADDNKLMVSVSAAEESAQGATSTVGYVALSDFKDVYLLATVNLQIAALQAKPANGAFASPVTMTVTGAVTGTTSFDGSANFSLALSMPANAIPISSVTDLASTLSTIQSEASAPPALEASFYSNLNAATQTSMMGYWNTTSTSTTGQDAAGVVLELTSDASNTTNSTNYASQLCMGSNGTLTWRRNTNNSGWTQVAMWHSGNFNPAGYVPVNTTPTLAGLNIQGPVGSTDAANLAQGTTTGNDLIVTTGPSTARVSYKFGEDGVFYVINGGISINGEIEIPDGVGLTYPGGGFVTTGPAGATPYIGTTNGTGSLLSLLSGTTIMASWANDGAYASGANITTTATIQGLEGIFTQSVVAGGTGPAVGNAPLDVVTADGHLLVFATASGTTLNSINAGNTAQAALAFDASSYTFLTGNAVFNANATIDGNLTVDGTTTIDSLTATGEILGGTATFGSTGNTGIALEAITAGSINGVNVVDNGGNGANIKLSGNGTTTPSKTIRVIDGAFQLLNDAYSANLLTVDDNGNTVIEGTLTSVGIANFNTSDKRLKKILSKIEAKDYHRAAPLYSYQRKDSGEFGEGPLAQDIRAVNKLRTSEYNHGGGKAKAVKRLAIDTSGIALEQAYWASNQIDEIRGSLELLAAEVESLKGLPNFHKRTKRIIATVKKLSKRS